MNTDTHYNPGGGGAAYAVRNPDQKPEPGDRIRTLTGSPGVPVYGTVLLATDSGDAFQVRLDNGLTTVRLARQLTFHGRPHEAFNTHRETR